MNSLINARSTYTAAQLAASLTALRASVAPVVRQPWFLCAMVILVALLSTYVHVVNGQVERGERLRSQGLAQVGKPGKATAAQLIAQAAQANRQPVTTVNMDTGR